MAETAACFRTLRDSVLVAPAGNGFHRLQSLREVEKAIWIDRLFDALKSAQIARVIGRPPIAQRRVGKILIGAAGGETPHRFVEAVLPVAVTRHQVGAVRGPPKQSDVEQ